MTLTLKQHGKSHAEILADGKWIATVRTEDDPERAEVVRAALEAHQNLPGAKTAVSS